MLELPGNPGKGECTVLKCFTRNETIVGGRVIQGRKRRQARAKPFAHSAGVEGEDIELSRSETHIQDRDIFSSASCKVPNGDHAREAEQQPKGLSVDTSASAMPHKRRRKRHSGASINGTFTIMENGHIPINGRAHSSDYEDQGEIEHSIEEAEVPEKLDEAHMSGAWVKCMVASEDGQWLAMCDTSGHSLIFNLDILQASLLRQTRIKG